MGDEGVACLLDRRSDVPETVLSEKREGPTAGAQTFGALEFLAMLLCHAPERCEVLVREYGAYSVVRRARWRREGILAEAGLPAEIPAPAGERAPDWPALRRMRQRRAEMLKRIFEVDPLQCERCGGPMRIVAFVIDPEVIGAILRHLRRAGDDPRMPAQRSPAAGTRGPP